MHIIESHIIDLINFLIKKPSFPIISKHIDINQYDIKIQNLPSNFIGFKIFHISDLHGINLLDYYPHFLTQIQKQKPDILVISGDICHDDYYEKSIEFLDQIKDIIPYKKIFISTGNHEFLSCKHHRVVRINDLSHDLTKRKVNFMRNQVFNYQIDKQKISIIGIDDPWNSKNEKNYLDWQLRTLTENIPSLRTKILISHRPEYINIYSKYNIDLVFSGHTHGGQIFFPFINRGLYTPNQGFFKKNIKGYNKINDTQIIISAGIGNESLVPRFNNPGDINFITLK